MHLVNLSALWRINLWVTCCFAVLTLACAGVLLHQASTDVKRELRSAEAVMTYMAQAATQHSASLQPALTEHLRHLRVRWLESGDSDETVLAPKAGLDGWLGAVLAGKHADSKRLLILDDGRRVLLTVDARDEVDEVWDSLQQLLGVCAVALALSLLSIRWAVNRGLRSLGALLCALRQVSGGQLAVRLKQQGGPEARQLAGHFNQMATALEQAQADNRRLTRALLAVQEQERTQLAQALHDDLGQYVAGIRAQACLLHLCAGQPDQVRQTAQTLESNCEGLQVGFRALVRDLYPVALQHMPLAEAFNQLVSQWRASQAIECQLLVGAQLPTLSPARCTHLYRLLQEALTNVARHAQASQVRVRLQRGANGLRLLVRDDGRGAGQPQRHGVGLHSMAERARSLGAELRILTRPGAGWALTLTIPLEVP
nr:HAMP domain-containing sensor histidine kinase [uncultured Pseudomonas sp.]